MGTHIEERNGVFTSAQYLLVARRNAALFVFVMYFSDFFWIIISRVTFPSSYSEFYKILPFDWVVIVNFFVAALGFSIVGAGWVFFVKPFPRIEFKVRTIHCLFFLATLINCYLFVSLEDAARYTSGAMTGASGLLYIIANASTLSLVMVMARERRRNIKVPSYWAVILLISYAVNIDGLASALTLGVFIFLLFDLRVTSISKLLLMMVVSAVLFWVGFNAKFQRIPDYLSVDFMGRWIVARFSIQAEQMYTYISGGSVIGRDLSLLDLVLRAASNRIDIVLGNAFYSEYPRSVSEAVYYDMMGEFGAGSSPGALLGTYMFSWIGAMLFPLFFSFIFVNFFYGYREKITFFQACLYVFAFKTLHSNVAEYVTIISPVSIVFVFVVFFSLISFKRNFDEVGK